jgi:hypothetical protein
MLKSNAIRVPKVGDPCVRMLRLEHLHHRSSCLGAGVLRQHDSTTIASHHKANSGAEFTVENNVIVLSCDQLLVGRIPAAAFTPHGFTYNVLHKGIVLATYPQGQPPLHPAFNAPGTNDPWALPQDTCDKDQGAFRVPLPLVLALNSLANVVTTRWPTPLLGGLYIGCGCDTARLYLPCQMPLSAIPPSK